MNILFNTYPVAFDCPGGGEIQLLKSKEALEGLGVNVIPYDPWQPQFDQAQAVHFFSVMGGSSVFCNYVKHNRRLPLAISPILWITEETYGAGLYPVDEIRHLLNLADVLLPNSQIEAVNLAQVFGVPIEKFHPVVNGIDDFFFQEGISADLFRQKFGIEGPFLLNVGNIEPRKNQWRLVQAVRDLGIDLVVLGNIRDPDYFHRCLEESQGCMKYLGYVPHQSELLLSAYTACELFVLPSTLETPGLSALEAAATGAKIVLTAEGCTREYFGDFVEYVEPMSVESIRAGVEAQLKAARPVGLREHVAAHYTWRRAAEQLQEAYSRIV
ncbi:MAG: glycosyltransferase [Cyanobacteria bacterium Co-bin13]|nr:glycosyltransferase [Cyanobacteria bacterium Co-bin13]